jgi:hypothetical protein
VSQSKGLCRLTYASSLIVRSRGVIHCSGSHEGYMLQSGHCLMARQLRHTQTCECSSSECRGLARCVQLKLSDCTCLHGAESENQSTEPPFGQEPPQSCSRHPWGTCIELWLQKESLLGRKCAKKSTSRYHWSSFATIFIHLASPCSSSQVTKHTLTHSKYTIMDIAKLLSRQMLLFTNGYER